MLGFLFYRTSPLLKVSQTTSRQLIFRHMATSSRKDRPRSDPPFQPNASAILAPYSTRTATLGAFSMNVKHMSSNSGRNTGPSDSDSPTPSSRSQDASNQGPRYDQDDASKHLQSYPRFLRRLAATLPKPPHLHRPTRDDFLNVANSMWDRTRIRFKWLTIRGFRKFNADGNIPL